MTTLALLALSLLCQPKDYPIEKRWEGTGGKLDEPQVRLARGAHEWKTLWVDVFGDGQAVPDIDFKRFFVIAVIPEGRWTGVRSVAQNDGKAITVTLSLGGKFGPIEAFKQCHALLVLPRTPLTVVVQTQHLGCAGIDKPKTAATFDMACRKFNDCGGGKGLGDHPCPGCGNECKKGSDGFFNRKCAEELGLCHLCGGVEPAVKTCAKPNACHDTHLAALGRCSSCKAEIPNCCDKLCKECADDKWCRLCGGRIEK